METSGPPSTRPQFLYRNFTGGSRGRHAQFEEPAQLGPGSGPDHPRGPMTLPAVTVRQVMNASPACVSPDTPVQEALQLMNARRIGTVLVVEGEGRLLGIFTERDLI